jgi:deoxyadenosine/deoxycytidine kinase
MIVFINGAFGVGKTTVAERLEQQIPHSLLFDPEEVGYLLQKVLHPIEKPDDFQHYTMWRPLVVKTAQLLQETYQRTLIMPMTIWHIPYFEEVMGGLRKIEPNFYHFCLTAPVSVLHARLEQRGEEREGWAWMRAEWCHTAYQSPLFEQKIPTETATPEEITQKILSALTTPPS